MTNLDPDFEQGQSKAPDEQPSAAQGIIEGQSSAGVATFSKGQRVRFKGQPAEITSVDPLDLQLVDGETGNVLLGEQKQPLWYGKVDPKDIEVG